MSATTLIYLVGIGIFSLAFIFMFMLLKPVKITKEKLQKVLGKDNVDKILNATTPDDIKKVIISLSKRRKLKLKTLAESQNLIDAMKLINDVLLNSKKFANKENLQEIVDLSIFKEKNIEEIKNELKKLDKEKRAKLQELFITMSDDEIAKGIKEIIDKEAQD